MWHLEAPVLRAFASKPFSSSSWPILAQKATISASYFSLIQDKMTEVSSLPEYASTIFMRATLLAQPLPCNSDRRADFPVDFQCAIGGRRVPRVPIFNQ